MEQQYSQIKDLNGRAIKIIEKGDNFFIGRHGSAKMNVSIEQLELILEICKTYTENRKTTKQCPCLRCIKQRDIELGRIFQSAMQLCPVCGNKRCPKGTNHDLDCSGSNLQGQDGSSYE